MSDPGTIGYWKEHARGLRGQLGKAADEIERLRGDNKTIGDHANNLVEKCVEKDKRIEELELEKTTFPFHLCKTTGVNRVGSQEACVECGNVHIITAAEIDAAVAVADKWHPMDQKTMWVVLQELGIERCPDSHCVNGEDTRPMPCSYPACKVCNGHGWVMSDKPSEKTE